MLSASHTRTFALSLAHYISLFYPLLLTTLSSLFFFFFFNDTATTEIYTLSLHDALPISVDKVVDFIRSKSENELLAQPGLREDRKSTRLNSSHITISYAVFCLKKKKKKKSKKQYRQDVRVTYHKRDRLQSTMIENRTNVY